ncbi:MAG: MFS transporter [Candidatus Wallbacteria bacterium]|nr:MFS transporter [Candidatus Wallbacteria bacterium]
MPTANESSSLWSPFRHRLFRLLWFASLASNIGTSLHDVSAAWLMTSLTLSPIMIALMQAASTFPVFLLALPAGAIADVVDRRRLLLFTQTWMALAAAALSLLTLSGHVVPTTLLALTLIAGLGMALNIPVWQAITADMVPRHELAAAAAAGGIGFNMARVVGPALGGLLLAAAGPGPSGPGAVFMLNAVSFLGVIGVLYGWQPAPASRRFPVERIWEAMATGIRYGRRSARLQAILVRTAPFVFCASAAWSQLALIARTQVHATATGYGLLLASLGVGAVFGGTLLPAARRALSLDRLAGVSYGVFAAVLFAVSGARSVAGLIPWLLAGGAVWMFMMSSMNAAVQLVAPAWVRGRALSLHLLVFMAAFSAGSVVWGVTASKLGLPRTFVLASAGIVIGWLLTASHRLVTSEDTDFSAPESLA